MELKTFVSEIVKDWSEYPKSKKVKKIEGLNGYLSYETGLSGENYTIKKLRKLHPKYEFVLTDGSKSPADIIGLNKNTKYWHFALFQVKTSKETKMLTSEINEKYTLPILSEIIKSRFLIINKRNRNLKKQIFITSGYIGIHKQKNHSVFKSLPYPKSFSLNNLNLTSTEKTEIKNSLHRNIK